MLADRIRIATQETPENRAWFCVINIVTTGVWYSELMSLFPGIMRALERHGEAWVRLPTLMKLKKYLPFYSDGPSMFPGEMKNPCHLHY